MLTKINWSILFLVTMCVCPIQMTYANSERAPQAKTSENPYLIKVKEVQSSISAPTFSNDHWAVHRTIFLENGLYAVRNTTWSQEDEALLETELPFPKEVTIILFSGNLFYLESDNPHRASIAELGIDSAHPFQLPHIVAIDKRKIILNSGLYYGQAAWHYTIELSDGTFLEGVKREPCYDWTVGEEVITVGTKYRPILINKTRVLYRDKGYHTVNETDSLRFATKSTH